MKIKFIEMKSNVLVTGMGENGMSNPRCLGEIPTEKRKVNHSTLQDIWEIMTKMWTGITRISSQDQVFE